jgi:hypothetical protein
MTALTATKEFKTDLGGAISIGGRIPSSCMLVNRPKKTAPVLLLGGSKESMASGDAVRSTKGTLEHVEHHQWKKADDSMLKAREKALPVTQFLARRLRSQKGVPEGSVELSRAYHNKIRDSISSLLRR